MNWVTWQIFQWRAPSMVWTWIDSLRALVDGKKTYITAVAMMLHAAAHYFLDPSQQSVDTRELLDGLGLMFLRKGVSKVAEKG